MFSNNNLFKFFRHTKNSRQVCLITILFVGIFFMQTVCIFAKEEIDSDQDVLPNDIEKSIGTDPNKKDSDNDGSSDY